MSPDSIFLVVVLILSVVIHEVSHGAMANFLGDPTARLQGRLTLNPLKHVDMMGSVILPAIMILSHSPILFGWAKPVPYNPYNLRRGGKYAESLVALAGPASNMAIALIFSAVLHLGLIEGPALGLAIKIIFLNIVLAIFNMIPIPPLDGSKVLSALLPVTLAVKYDNFRKMLESNPFLGFGLVIFLVTLFGNQFYWFISKIATVLMGM